MKIETIEIVEDRTPESRCDEGFLTVARLVVRNRYDDGSHSAAYPCDVMRRPGSDAVVAVLYERSESDAPESTRVRVVLREAVRVPIFLRHEQTFVHPDPRVYRSILETVAGMVEPDDPPGSEGLKRRAAAEAREEAGLDVPAAGFVPLGGETFASPGMTDEKLYFCAGQARLDERQAPAGDGSTMEEWAELHVLDLATAIEQCRSGEIPDMKTEIALLRLADHLGYLPQLGCFASELPPEWAARHGSLGVERFRGTD